MTPSETIVARTATCQLITDELGRRLSVRQLSALDTLRLFKAAGPILAENQPWLAMAMLAAAVVAIDDVPVPSPATEQQIESLVARLGDSGLAAVARLFEPQEMAQPGEIGHSLGN
jgi:hypothetical protein